MLQPGTLVEFDRKKQFIHVKTLGAEWDRRCTSF